MKDVPYGTMNALSNGDLTAVFEHVNVSPRVFFLKLVIARFS